MDESYVGRDGRLAAEEARRREATRKNSTPLATAPAVDPLEGTVFVRRHPDRAERPPGSSDTVLDEDPDYLWGV